MNSKIDIRQLSTHNGPEESPGFLLWRVSTSWRTAIEAVLKPLKLTHPQFVVLATLSWLTKDGERVTQASVGKLAGLDPNTVSQILQGLEKKGLIERAGSLDQRAKNPFLTAEGQQTLAKSLPAVESADAHFFKALSKQDSQELVTAFQKLMAGKSQ